MESMPYKDFILFYFSSRKGANLLFLTSVQTATAKTMPGPQLLNVAAGSGRCLQAPLYLPQAQLPLRRRHAYPTPAAHRVVFTFSGEISSSVNVSCGMRKFPCNGGVLEFLLNGT